MTTNYNISSAVKIAIKNLIVFRPFYDLDIMTMTVSQCFRHLFTNSIKSQHIHVDVNKHTLRANNNILRLVKIMKRVLLFLYCAIR